MKIYIIPLAAAMLVSFILPSAHAEEDGMGAVEYKDSADRKPATQPPKVGRKAAQKYMGQTSDSAESTQNRDPAAVPKEAHYLALHVGTYLTDDAYKWGSDHETNVGKFNLGVTYRLGEWQNAADLNFRADFSTFNLTNGGATKLSFLPVIIFPDASSHFPIYFGAGVGPGFYLKQIQGQSAISLDYQLFLGARFFNVFDTTGFFVEAGVKNHFHVFSNGQYNGEFVAVGALFTF